MFSVTDILKLDYEFEGLNIKHFSAKEIVKGWDIPDELLLNILPTVYVLDVAREKFKVPFHTDSVYRSKSYNKAVGGKPKSLHLDFNAIDFTVENKSKLKAIYDFLDEVDKEIGWFRDIDRFQSKCKKVCGNLGLGLYPTFIHIDTRGTLGRQSPARWKG